MKYNIILKDWVKPHNLVFFCYNNFRVGNYEKNLGESVITSEINLNYKYIDYNKKIDNK